MTECSLCDLPATPPVTDSHVDGEFCCRGCLEVSRTLGDVDIDDIEPDVDDSENTQYPDDAQTTYLAVEGMHCSTCELFLESLGADQEGVYDVDASYAAEAIKIVYDPDLIDEETLQEAISGWGYRARAREESPERETDELASRLLVGGIFSMMAMTWYAIFLYPTYFGYDPVVSLGTFDGAYLYGQLAVVTAIVLLYTGQPMLRGAYISLKTRQPNVDLLVSVAALAAYAYSTGRLFVGGTDLYYDVTIVVVMAVTIGNYYETRIKRRTAGLLADLTAIQVEEATTRDGETIPVEAIESGDELRVRPGERIPVDGTIVEGTAAIDEALVTGESVPERKSPGDSVRGGTIVTDAPVVVAAGAEAESTLDRLVGMLWDIQATRPGAQRVADTLATVFVPLVLLLAAVVGVAFWLSGVSAGTAVLVSLTVLIVSCPCALGLATPLAVATGLQSAADRGIVVANASLFEEAPAVDTVVFDKTGTLTSGEMVVTDWETADESVETVLRLAGALEQYSKHPIGTAITAAAERTMGAGPSETTVSANDVDTLARGVAGTVEGRDVLVGHPDLFEEREWGIPDALESLERTAAVPVFVGWDGVVHGSLSVSDQRRSGWEEVLDGLGEQYRLVVLTGDERANASWLTEHPAVDEVFAGVPPDGKTETIRRLTATSRVAMVGDGSNDAPALAAADVGISLDSGTELAAEAADAVVLDGDIRQLPAVFDTAAGTNRRIKENIAWAFLYNGVAIPLAVSGLLNPLFAAVAMATSSLFVVANSARSQPGVSNEPLETTPPATSREPDERVHPAVGD